MLMNKILIVDDDLALADVLAFTLRRAGFEIAMAHDGPSALRVFRSEQPALVVLDWNLPGLNGLAVGEQLRAMSQVPIIMLTVRDDNQDAVAALEACADDYVTKPFSPSQLVARVRAVLRRTIGEQQETFTSGPMLLDLERHEVRYDSGPPISLSRLEARLLQALMQNADHVLTTESLITRIWGPGGGSRGMLKQLVYRLRKKIEIDPDQPHLIEVIHGIGYQFNALSSESGS